MNKNIYLVNRKPKQLIIGAKMKNSITMHIKHMYYFYIIVLIGGVLSKPLSAQSFNDTVGIPIILFTEVGPDIINADDLDSMKQMGVDVILQNNVDNNLVNLMYPRGLKVIPNQIWSAYNYILQYTDAHYTLWEAEGTPPEQGEVTLKYHNDISSLYYENGTKKGVRTNYGEPADTMISGPGYRQDGQYRLAKIKIEYTADYVLKIIPAPKINLTDLIYQNIEVCTLRVTSKQKSHAGQYWDSTTVSTTPVSEFDTVLYVSDFTPSEWDTFSIVYDWSNGGLPTAKVSDKGINEDYQGQYVEFIVDWSGSQYLSLAIDNVCVYDNKGLTLKDDPALVTARIDSNLASIINQNAIYLWYAIDEPYTIDNYEPYRIVDSLVDAQSNHTKQIITSLDVGFNGRYGACQEGSFKVFTAKEFRKRAKPKFIWLNAYPYHYFYKPGEHPNWREENIRLLTDNKFKVISALDNNWGYNIQATKWINVDTSCNESELLITPTSEMILYNVNLALLFGAKTLGFYEYYSLFNNKCNVLYADGLVDLARVPNERYNLIKNVITPRL